MNIQRTLLLIALLLGMTTLSAQPDKSVKFGNTTFPSGNYVPFGYLDNPAHSYINRSGIIRSVPPVGMGYWTTSLPWPYATRMARQVNYLSFFHLGFSINGKSLVTSDDYQQLHCNLHSAYHTKNILQYNWELDGITWSASYYMAGENNLLCRLEIKNTTASKQTVTVHATHEYGYVESRWWGSSGITSNYDSKNQLLVDKLWEYGDIFVLGNNITPVAVKSTANENEWQNWIRKNDLSSDKGKSIDFQQNPALYSMQSYSVELDKNASKTCTFIMSRATNQLFATNEYQATRKKAEQVLDSLITQDNRFYADAPRLVGDWPDSWQQGWVYDFETLRMTVRQPSGIYKHHWDGMQVYAPRAVLGESALDMLCLSYSDINIAKEVLLGTFADAPMPNVPCSREDGSMNMIGAGGEECGTSPVWGLPFSVIYSVYQRSGDTQWLKSMYPYMKSFLNWWLANRTDKEGWFHCNNSWESGQDGSLRFTFEGGSEADVTDFVRTVDVEAAMADAMIVMSKIAPLTGHSEDTTQWNSMSKDRAQRMRTMYKDGWFRDIDGRTGKPIMIDTYHDVMMLLPLTVGLATPEQAKEITPRLNDFTEGKGCLVWPPGILFYTEAMRYSGQRELGSKLIVSTGNRIYERASTPSISTSGRKMTHLPDKYNYRIPGVSNEFWPIDLASSVYGGAESYGWGATLPAMTIRSLFGFTETDKDNEFQLAPYIPSNLSSTGKRFGISNLSYRNYRINCICIPQKDNLQLELTISSDKASKFKITNSSGKTILSGTTNSTYKLKGKNGEKVNITIDN